MLLPAGSHGTVSWLAYGLGRRVYVMWDVPEDPGNFLAVGISTNTAHHENAHTFMLQNVEGDHDELSFRKISWNREQTSVHHMLVIGFF